MLTLLVNGGSYANLRETLLKNVAVLQFPFGSGGPKMKLINPTSLLEMHKHHFNLQLKQFMRGDLILLLNHMHNRKLFCQTAMTKCRSKVLCSILYEKISLLNIEDLNHQINCPTSSWYYSRILEDNNDFLYAGRTHS